MATSTISVSTTYTATERDQYVFITPSSDFVGSATYTPVSGAAVTTQLQPSVVHTYGRLVAGDVVEVTILRGTAKVDTGLQNFGEIAALRSGLKYQPFPFVGLSTVGGFGSGQFRGAGLVMTEGTKISNTYVVATTGGTGVTLAKTAIYNKDRELLASSADASGSFGAAGAKTIPLSATLTIPATDWDYVGLLLVFSTTSPNILGTPYNTNGTNAFWTGLGGVHPTCFASSLADIPTSFAASDGVSPVPWVGLR